MSTLQVNNIQLNQEGNAAISIANSYNVVISVDGTQKIKLHQQGIDFSSGITINNVPVISGTGALLSLPSVGTSGNVLTSNGTAWISQAIPAPTINLRSQVTNTLQVSNGGTGLTAVGTSGNVLTSNGTAWVSQEPTGYLFKAIAKDQIYDGAPIVINRDGTVSEVVGSNPTTLGTFAGAGAEQTSAVYNSTNNNIIVAIRGNPGLNANVFFITASSNLVNDTISISNSFKGSNANNSLTSQSGPFLGYDSDNNKVICAFSTSYQSFASIGVVTGDRILDFGPSVLFANSTTSGSMRNMSVAYDKTNKKVVITYADSNNLNYGTAIVGNISGNTITFGTPVVFNSADTNYMSCTYHDEQNRIVISYLNVGTSRGTIIAGTVSGSSISFGTAIQLVNNSMIFNKLFYDSSYNRIIAAYMAGSATPTVSLLSLTNTTFTFRQNTNTTLSGYNSGLGTSFSWNTDKKILLCAYNRTVTEYSNTVVFASTSNDNVYFTGIDSVNTFDQGRYHTIIYDPTAKKTVHFYNDWSQATKIQTINDEGRRTNLKNNNYIGIATSNYANGTTASIQLMGVVDDAQSGLTPSLTYYVKANGALSTVPDANNDSGNVIAGLALSSNQLLIRYS